MILVTGCPRSGTKYYAGLLQRCGLDVTHENTIGHDGIASWWFGDWSKRAPSAIAGSITPTTVIHLVRHPLDCIASMATLKASFWEWVGEENKAILGYENGPLRWAAFWHSWNSKIENKWRVTRRVRVEDLPQIDGVDRNAREHGPVSWEDLNGYAQPIQILGKRYGYDIEEKQVRIKEGDTWTLYPRPDPVL